MFPWGKYAAMSTLSNASAGDPANSQIMIYFIIMLILYNLLKFICKDVTMVLMSMSGWMSDSFLRKTIYMGQKQSFQDKVNI